MEKECKFAIFSYEPSDADLVDELAEYLDEHAQIAFDFFEVEVPKEKIEIQIVPTKKDYDEQYRRDSSLPLSQEVPKWITGHFNRTRKEILYLSLHDFKNTSNSFEIDEYPKMLEWYKNTLVHEFVHYVNELFREKHSCSYTEKFLEEGIATYLSKERENQPHNYNFTLNILLEKSQNCYYDAYYLITKYFIENYDKNYVLQVFQSNRQARELLTNELYDKAKEYYSKNNTKTKTL